MRKTGLIFFFVCVIFKLFSQLNQVDSKGRKQGEWQKTYPESKALEYKGQFKDDKPIGTFYYFYPSTKTKAIVIHDDKTGRSSAKLFHENGLKMAIGIYINQKKDSVWTHYGSSGKISFKETYKEGKLNGKKTIYYVSGEVNDKSERIAAVENYINGVKDGDQIEYFEDGSVKSSAKYEKGIRVGKFVQNHSNGKPMIIENYKDGVLHGWSYGYDESGKELGKRYFKRGIELKGKELDKWLKYCMDKKIDPNE